MAIEPSLLLKNKMSDMQYHFNTRVIYQDLMWFGLSYRQFDALVILFGVDYGQYFFGYSYDSSISEISGYNSGSHELLLDIIFNQK